MKLLNRLKEWFLGTPRSCFMVWRRDTGSSWTEKERNFFKQSFRLPSDTELMDDFTKMVERYDLGEKCFDMGIYNWDDTQYPPRTRNILNHECMGHVKGECILERLFDLSLANSIRGIEFIGYGNLCFDLMIFVDRSTDGTTNITPEFMEFMNSFLEKRWKWMMKVGAV